MRRRSTAGAVMCQANSDTAFGYHYHFTTTGGASCYYAVVPSLTDTCLKNSCPSPSTSPEPTARPAFGSPEQSKSACRHVTDKLLKVRRARLVCAAAADIHGILQSAIDNNLVPDASPSNRRMLTLV